jgi:hypothetical protein
MRARCPRSRVESGFISVLGLSSFGPSTLHFQNFRISEFQNFRISEFQNFRISEFQNFSVSAFTPRGGTNVGTGRKFPKKVSVPAYPAFAYALKTRRSPALKPFRLFRSGA